MTTPSPTRTTSTNTFAIVAIITVWFGGLIGLIFGYVALSQIKRTGEGGRGLALTAVVVGWIASGLALLSLILIPVLLAGAAASISG